MENKIYTFAVLMSFKNIILIIISGCLLNACHSNTAGLSSSNASAPAKDTTKIQTAQQAADTTIKDGTLVKRYPNGIIKERSNYVGGRRQGECQSFYPTGKLWSDDYFTAGLIEGATTVYYENGQKEYDGFCTKGKPCGIWKFYDQKGKLVHTVDYSKKRNNPAT